jgi:ComF family protein
VTALLGGLARGLGTLAGGTVDLLLPAVCLTCDAAAVTAQGLCDDCNVKLLSLVAEPYCPRCGTSLGPGIPVREAGCSSCPSPLGRFVRVIRLGPYAGPLKKAVRSLKSPRSRAIGRRLGGLLAHAVRAGCPEDRFDMAVAVPAHWIRRLSRNGDHARQLVRTVATPLKLPIGDDLVRIRHTPAQVRMSRTQRIDNVRGAFAVRNPKSVVGANILLIDDVTTTGATANEATMTLLKAGALRVTLAVVAKGGSAIPYAESTAP